jgi:DNA-binding NtrC family response regulator
MEYSVSNPAPPSSPPDQPSARSARVLVVDDEPSLRRTLARSLMGHGYEVLTAEDGQAALALLASSPIDVALIDLSMPRLDGVELHARIREQHQGVEVVLMTDQATVGAAVAAVEAGAHGFVLKPFAAIEVVPLAIAKAAEHRRLLFLARDLEQRIEQRERFGELVGSNPRMREVYRVALGVASTSSAVMIVGESGTGKELVARAVHQHGPRSGRPFVAVNCGAIPAELVEGELFGHARGAVAGATAERGGLVEAADKGTLFLDEVGSLPLPVQVRVLRLLQEGETSRVGASGSRSIDVRVIAATDVDLKSRVSSGGFREDLFYRLNVIPIRLPALRQRRDDIPLLGHYFVQKYAKRSGRDVKRISVEAMRVLREYRWPGNVRELENCIERAVVLSRSDTIFPGDLPFPSGNGGRSPGRPDDAEAAAADGQADADGHGGDGSPSIAVASGWEDLPYGDAKEQVLEAFHHAYLGSLLTRTGGNVSEAARQAGLDRSNFRRVLKRYGNPIGRAPEPEPEP